jgi:hypothetical protein
LESHHTPDPDADKNDIDDHFTPTSFGEVLENPGLYDVMQFTGLHDRNGKEIYEGDILESPRDGAGRKLIAVVSWSDKLPGFYHDVPYKWNELKVIGNIHRNMSLLGRI